MNTTKVTSVSMLFVVGFIAGCTLYKNDARKYFEANISEIIEAGGIQASCHRWSDPELNSTYLESENQCALQSVEQDCLVSSAGVDCEEDDPALAQKIMDYFAD